jgi:hypothetical protein
MNIYQKLMAARIELQKHKLEKSGKNTFSKYSYFELEDFLPAVQKIFHDIGLCGIVSFKHDLAVLTITDGGDHSIQITSPMADAQLKAATPIQNLGAVHTYLRRYLWVTALEICEHDIVDPMPAQINVQEYIDAMQLTDTVEQLTNVYTQAIQGITDKDLIKQLKAAAVTRKTQLTTKE